MAVSLRLERTGRPLAQGHPAATRDRVTLSSTSRVRSDCYVGSPSDVDVPVCPGALPSCLHSHSIRFASKGGQTTPRSMLVGTLLWHSVSVPVGVGPRVGTGHPHRDQTRTEVTTHTLDLSNPLPLPRLRRTEQEGDNEECMTSLDFRVLKVERRHPV